MTLLVGRREYFTRTQGGDSMDLNDLKAGAAEFSSLSTSEKYSWVTRANRISHEYHTKYVRFRRSRKEQFDRDPHLHLNEMVKFGDLDPKEAKRFCYESYTPERFEDYLQKYRTKQLEDVLTEWKKRGFKDEPLKLEPEKFAPDFNEEYFVDTKFHELPRYDKETKPTLDSESLYPGQREDILAGVSDYRTDIDMMNKREKKISIPSEERKNLLARIGMYQKREQRVMKNDDEASSETRSSESDLGAFSEIKINKDAENCPMKKKEKALKKKKKKKKKEKNKKKRSYY